MVNAIPTQPQLLIPELLLLFVTATNPKFNTPVLCGHLLLSFVNSLLTYVTTNYILYIRMQLNLGCLKAGNLKILARAWPRYRATQHLLP
jgi:hypothetical protein